jgi:hypothetical protein
MKFMLLLFENDAERIAQTEARLPSCHAYVEAMQKAGIYVSGERLDAVTATTTVRVASGRPRVIDGPYAETKEQLGGFHVIDVPDLDAALQWAARCPSASRGRVEVRPLWPDTAIEAAATAGNAEDARVA